MKNKKIAILAVIIVIVLILIIIIANNSNKNKSTESKLIKIYDNLVSSQTYLFTMEQNDKNKTIMAKKGEKTVIDSYTEGNRSTTLIKDGNTYLILHDREEYYVYGTDNVEQSILTDGIGELLNRQFETGSEKVKGKKYQYEEYSGSTFFMVSNMLNMDEEQVKTRLYFDKNQNLVYVKIINGEEEEILKIEITNEVEDSRFEIPSHYAEN